MFNYQFRTPRVAFGVAAMAMTALTLGALVVLPSLTQSDSQRSAMLAAYGGVAGLRATALSQLQALRSHIVGTQKNPHAAERS